MDVRAEGVLALRITGLNAVQNCPCNRLPPTASCSMQDELRAATEKAVEAEGRAVDAEARAKEHKVWWRAWLHNTS